MFLRIHQSKFTFQILIVLTTFNGYFRQFHLMVCSNQYWYQFYRMIGTDLYIIKVVKYLNMQ